MSSDQGSQTELTLFRQPLAADFSWNVREQRDKFVYCAHKLNANICLGKANICLRALFWAGLLSLLRPSYHENGASLMGRAQFRASRLPSRARFTEIGRSASVQRAKIGVVGANGGKSFV